MQLVKKIGQVVYGKRVLYKGTILAVDISGSVGGNVEYWNVVANIYDSLPKERRILLWDSNYQQVEEKVLMKFIAQRKGVGGTSPHVIVAAMEAYEYSWDSTLVLITDGQVGSRQVLSMTQQMKDNSFKAVQCHIVSPKPDLSVTCPFTRGNSCEVYSYSHGVKKQELSLNTQDYRMLDQLSTMSLQNFLANFTKIENMLIALNMGKKGNEKLKNQLIALQKKFVKEFAKDKDKGYGSALWTALRKGAIEEALMVAQAMSDEYHSEGLAVEFQSKMGYLVNLCGSLEGKFSIDQIKSKRVTRAKEVEEVPAQSLPEIKEAELQFQCPIFLQEDCPLLMIRKEQPLLLGEQKFVVDDVLNCPLRLLHYPALVEKLKKRLMQPIGLKFFSQTCKEKGAAINPFTNEVVQGVISMGCEPSHLEIGESAMANMLTGGKRAGNISLLFVVIWKVSKQLQYLKPISQQMDRQLRYRMEHSWSSCSLCGLPNYNSIRVPCLVALWYSIHSIKLRVPAESSPIRFHVFNSSIMVQVLQFLGLQVSGEVLNNIRLLRGMMSLLSFVKRSHLNKSYLEQCLVYYKVELKPEQKGIPSLSEVHYYLKEQAAPEQQIRNLLKEARVEYLTRDQALHLLVKVDRQLNSNNIAFVYNQEILPHPPIVNYWNVKNKQFQMHICQKTMRPRYKTQHGTWKDSFLFTFGLPFQQARCLSVFSMYGQFVSGYEKFPSEQQFLAFLFKKCQNAKRVLPSDVEQSIEFVFRKFKEVIEITAISPLEFKSRFQLSAPIKKREQLQIQ